MNATEYKGADEQRRHAPERPEEERVFLRVVVCGMRQIAGKPPGSAGVTFLACADNVLVAHVRPRIGDRENIVRPMTVITFGGLRVSQSGDLAVIGVKVRRRDLLVTASALGHDFQLEPGEVGAAYRVRGMTVAADRQLLVRVRDESRVHTGFKLIRDSVVAFAAGGGDIRAIDA